VREAQADFKDELLDAVLALLLCAPFPVSPLSEVLPCVHVALQSGMQVGAAVVYLSRVLAYRPSAVTTSGNVGGEQGSGASAESRVSYASGREKLRPHLPSLLPRLDRHLLLSGGGAEASEKVQSEFFRIKQAALNPAQTDTRSAVSSSSSAGLLSSPHAIRQAILLFLGRLGGDVRYLLKVSNVFYCSAMSIESLLVLPLAQDDECVCALRNEMPPGVFLLLLLSLLPLSSSQPSAVNI
jgi:hypothetical protein